MTLDVTGPGGSNQATKTGYITVTSAPGGSGDAGGTPANTAGLVAAYGFEEASGTQVIDASGNANHGTISGASRVSTKQFGKALKFNGTSNWITVNDSASLDLSKALTVEAWVYPTVSLAIGPPCCMKEQTGLPHVLALRQLRHKSPQSTLSMSVEALGSFRRDPVCRRTPGPTLPPLTTESRRNST